jgi:hypothetical protein
VVNIQNTRPPARNGLSVGGCIVYDLIGEEMGDDQPELITNFELNYVLFELCRRDGDRDDVALLVRLGVLPARAIDRWEKTWARRTREPAPAPQAQRHDSLRFAHGFTVAITAAAAFWILALVVLLLTSEATR